MAVLLRWRWLLWVGTAVVRARFYPNCHTWVNYFALLTKGNIWQSVRSLCLFNALLVINVISVVNACRWNSQVNFAWCLLISFVFIGNLLCQFQYIMVIGGRIRITVLPVLLFRPFYCCYCQHYLTCVILHCFDVTHLSIKMVFNWF